MSDCCGAPEGNETDSGTAEKDNLAGVHDCCAPAPQGTENEESPASEPLCPANGVKGREVPMTAVASLVRWEVEAARLVDPKYFLCPDPSCETVYFGSEGAVIGKSDLRVRVGLKETEGPIPLCYCFDVTEGDIHHNNSPAPLFKSRACQIGKTVRGNELVSVFILSEVSASPGGIKPAPPAF